MANRSWRNITGKQNLLIDILALTQIPWFAGMLFGVFSTSLTIFGGYDFTSPLWSFGGADISVAFLAILFGLGWIVATNEIDGSEYETPAFAAGGFVLLSPILFVFVPSFESLVMMHGAVQLMFTVSVSAAATYLAYSA